MCRCIIFISTLKTFHEKSTKIMIKCCRFVKVDSLRQHLSVQDEDFLLQSSFKIIPMNSWHKKSVCCTGKTAVIQTSAAPQVSVSVYLWWVFLQSETKCLLNAQLCKLFCKRKTFMDISTAAWKSRGLYMQLSASTEVWQDFTQLLWLVIWEEKVHPSFMRKLDFFSAVAFIKPEIVFVQKEFWYFLRLERTMS